MEKHLARNRPGEMFCVSRAGTDVKLDREAQSDSWRKLRYLGVVALGLAAKPLIVDVVDRCRKEFHRAIPHQELGAAGMPGAESPGKVPVAPGAAVGVRDTGLEGQLSGRQSSLVARRHVIDGDACRSMGVVQAVVGPERQPVLNPVIGAVREDLANENRVRQSIRHFGKRAAGCQPSEHPGDFVNVRCIPVIGPLLVLEERCVGVQVGIARSIRGRRSLRSQAAAITSVPFPVGDVDVLIDIHSLGLAVVGGAASVFGTGHRSQQNAIGEPENIVYILVWIRLYIVRGNARLKRQQIVKCFLLGKRQDRHLPTDMRMRPVVAAGRHRAVHVMVVMDRQSILLQVVRAAAAAGSFASRLNRRQEQGDQHSDDRNDHQELNEREGSK